MAKPQISTAAPPPWPLPATPARKGTFKPVAVIPQAPIPDGTYLIRSSRTSTGFFYIKCQPELQDAKTVTEDETGVKVEAAVVLSRYDSGSEDDLKVRNCLPLLMRI